MGAFPLYLGQLAKFVLALLLTHAPPGKSTESFEVMPECGRDPKVPTCKLEPVCEQRSPFCAAPRWSKARHGWVRVETREAGAVRQARAAYALVRAANWLRRCKDADGNVVEDCRPIGWSQGVLSLAMAGLSSSVWESGYREDIMFGHPPLGRGTNGEVCVMQVRPEYVKQYADWTPSKDPSEMSEEDWAQEVLGDDVESLEHCFRVGLRILARMRATARRQCRGDWVYGMYAWYGNGKSCNGKTAELGDYARKRADGYGKFMSKWPTGASIPDWAVPMFGQIEGSRSGIGQGPVRR